MRKREPKPLDKLDIVFIEIDSCVARSSFLHSPVKALPSSISWFHAAPVAYLLHSASEYTKPVLLFIRLYFCFVA